MKKKIFGILLTLVLAVTGFGLVGCGGGNTPAPAPGPGPEPAPEVSYDDDTTPVAIEDTGLGFYLLQYDDLDQDNITHYNLQEDVGLAFVDGITGNNITDLVIPAYVRDEDNNTYKVVGIENLLYTFDAEAENGDWTDEFNEGVANIKTITIPSTVDYLDEHIFSSWYSYEDPENSESMIEGYYYLESLEGITLNNRTGLINGLYYEIRYLTEAIIGTEYPEGDVPDGAYETIMDTFLTYEEETDLYYLGNPGNPYMYLFFAGASYYLEEEPEGELVANVNENCVVIGEYGFHASCVTKVNVPSTLKAIGQGAFGYCSYITNMIIASNMYGTGDIYDTYYCNGDSINKWEILDRETAIQDLWDIVPDLGGEGNEVYYNIDPNGDERCYYWGNAENPYLYLVAYVNNNDEIGEFEVTINENCKVIGGYAFDSMPLVSINLPEGLTAIGEGAFYGTLLEEVELPNTLKYIGYEAFHNCENIDAIIVPASVEYLDCYCNAALYLQGLKMFEGNGYIAVGSFYIPVDLDYSDYSDVISQKGFEKADDTFTYGDVEYYKFSAIE